MLVSFKEKGSQENYPGFLRFQREVRHRIALEWGLDYPHFPPDTMDIIEYPRRK